MKNIKMLILLTLAFGFAGASASDIRLNTVGFLTHFPKRATVVAEAGLFAIRDASDRTRVVFSGRLQGPVPNPDTGEEVWIADFSALTEPGEYFLFVPNMGESPVFRISDDVFLDTYRAMMLGMYLWRCGNPGGVDASFMGVRYRHAVCHLNDANLRYVGGTGRQDGTGGWHDAGDYNKYTVNSGVTVGLMLKAWEHFGATIDGVPLISVANSGGLPAFLAEVKWNLDWVAKMQYDPDGRVSHKLSTLDFGGNIMPDQETETRYFAPWGTVATGSYTAQLALASRIYAPYNPAAAASWLARARTSFNFLLEHPEAHSPDQSAFTTGGYESSLARECLANRLWAAAELWETTGEPEFLEYLEQNLNPAAHVSDRTEWASVQNLASLTYLSSSRPGKNPQIVDAITARLITAADGIVSTAQSHGYGRTLGTQYYWGTNGAVASTAFTLYHAYKLTGNMEYLHTIHDALNYLLGRNYFGRSFVTRVGHNPPQNPHCRRSTANRRAWPGYLVGGPHNQGAETRCPLAATCWNDASADYRTNEIAINWNSAMIYALAAINAAPTFPASTRHTASPRARHTGRTTRVVRIQQGAKIEIPPGASVYTLDGRLVARRGINDARAPELKRNGVYIVKVR